MICPGDLADTVLDPEKYPEWRGLRTAMLLEFPTRMDLWEEYWDRYCRGLKRQGEQEDSGALPPVPVEASEFYRSNRTEMDAGARVSWEDRHPGCTSAIEYALVLFFRDEAAFYSEYQNEPKDPNADEEFLNAAAIERKVNNYARGEVPLGVEWLTCMVDVHKRALVWKVCRFEWNFTGYVIDYGVFPDQNRSNWRMSRARPTLTQKFPKLGTEGAIYKGLQTLIGDLLLPRQFLREDGATMQICKGLIDQQHESDTVKRVIREQRWLGTIFPSIGYGLSPGKLPISQYRQKPGELIGEEWVLRRPSGRIRAIKFDANYWKTFTQRRLAAEPTEPGALTIFGQEPAEGKKPRRKANHEALSRQIDSEVRKCVIDGDRRVDLWEQKPASENHWLDTLVGCHVAGSLAGARAAPQRHVPTTTKSPRKTLAERRAEKRRGAAA